MKTILIRLLLTLAFTPLAAFAIDGVTLINQATVMAAGGFPYVITQPGSYKLTGNLIAPAGVDGIRIGADYVTLDLNGFSIVGPYTSGGTDLAGVNATVPVAHSFLTVQNGNVTGFGYGVLGAAYTKVEHVKLIVTYIGVFASDRGAVVKDTIISGIYGVLIRVCPALIVNNLVTPVSAPYLINGNQPGCVLAQNDPPQ